MRQIVAVVSEVGLRVQQKQKRAAVAGEGLSSGMRLSCGVSFQCGQHGASWARQWGQSLCLFNDGLSGAPAYHCRRHILQHLFRRLHLALCSLEPLEPGRGGGPRVPVESTVRQLANVLAKIPWCCIVNNQTPCVHKMLFSVEYPCISRILLDVNIVVSNTLPGKTPFT